MSGGRPTKYDPAFCDVAISFLEQGYSTTALAGHLKVARSTIYKWAEENEAFSDALNTGQACGVAWWEDRLRDIGQGKDGNATAAIFALKNRGRDDWRDAQQTEVSGKLQTEETGAGAARLMAYIDGIAERSAETGEPDA